ncbi:MAG TPA: hypothetical protein QGI71_02570 [Dehalococcoidia bacterium]|nr:hypothetical protein [Dehalococcoidia bacterium]
MPSFDARKLLDEAEAARSALLDHARSVSESRVFGRTDRPGWTLKHELSSVAAADGELLHVFGELRRGRSLDGGGLDLRRRFAEAMLAVQHQRLSSIVERLEQDGAAFASYIDDHSDLLERPLKLAGREANSLGELAHGHVERLRAAVSAFDEHAKR